MRTYRHFIYFLALAVVLVLASFKLKHEEVVSFWQMRSIWWQAVLAGTLAGIMAAWIGYFLLPRRNLLMSLAMNQGAGLGIFLYFLFKVFFPSSTHSELMPLASGVLFAILITQVLLNNKKNRFVTEESLTGMLYVLSSGLIILIGDYIPEGRHEIDQLLFGNAVAVSSEFLTLLLLGAALFFTLQSIFFRHFVYASLDEDFLSICGIKTKRYLGILYVLLALGITLATMTLGSLPVFALMLMPAYLGLKLARSPIGALVLSLLLGLLMPMLGYFVSFVYALPTGAVIIALSGLFVLLQLRAKP